MKKSIAEVKRDMKQDKVLGARQTKDLVRHCVEDQTQDG